MTEARNPQPWGDLAARLAALEPDDRRTVSRRANLDLPEDPDTLLENLRDSGTTKGSPAEFIALVGVRVALEDGDLAARLGEVSVRIAESVEERQLAHACLAQTAFRFRKNPESLAAFEEHCEAAIALGHAGTFCYERLAVLYEYRGEIGRAVEVCRLAGVALSGDERSAAGFREKEEKILKRADGKHGRRTHPTDTSD